MRSGSGCWGWQWLTWSVLIAPFCVPRPDGKSPARLRRQESRLRESAAQRVVARAKRFERRLLFLHFEKGVEVGIVFTEAKAQQF